MHTDSSSGIAPQDSIEVLLTQALGAEQPERALQRLCDECPEHADRLRRRFRMLRELELLTDDDRPGLSIPEQFGEYRLLRLLGGGMGRVYLAEQPRLDRLVALKMLPVDALGSPQALERFRLEARVASRLEHAAICPVYDVGEVDGVPFLTMRYLPGQTLAARIAEQQEESRRLASRQLNSSVGAPVDRDAIDETLALLERIARALHFAHEAGLVHRDVKPSNILVGDDGEPVLLDFGLVRDDIEQVSQLTLSGQVVGTPSYMSPEQISPRAAGVDRTTDVYSLGVTLYECLTLHCPFGARTREALFRQILHGHPPDPRRSNPAIPGELAIVLETALDGEPSRRYRTAAAFADDLARVRHREAIEARRPGPLRRLLRWGQRHPVLAAFMALLLISQVAILALAALVQHESSRARRHLDNLDRVALTGRLRIAEEQADSLLPPWPGIVGELDRWSTELGEPLANRLPELRRTLDELRSAAETAGGSLEFKSDPDHYLYDALAALISDLTDFTDSASGTIADVRARLVWARRVHGDSIDAFRLEWDQAIAGIRASPKYGELKLAPQVGLVPLGADPVSGLFEFYHLRSATEGAPLPQRRSNGGFDVDSETGMIFVLVPAGRAGIGAQLTEPEAPFYDPDLGRWHPYNEVDLDAFFLSKYELTQAQWQRLGGDGAPCYFQPYSFEGVEDTGPWPVEQKSWLACTELTRRWGLALPTEAQWEYAARGSTHTPWYTGDEPSTVAGFENLSHVPEVPDLHELTAPVGRYRPNCFGFHDIGGNVSEWCRDEHGPYVDRPARNGDGLRLQVTDSDGVPYSRAVRGGSATNTTSNSAKPAYRGGQVPTTVSRWLGLRPARRIVPAGR